MCYGKTLLQHTTSQQDPFAIDGGASYRPMGNVIYVVGSSLIGWNLSKK